MKRFLLLSLSMVMGICARPAARCGSLTQDRLPNTYRGTVITGHSLMHLMPTMPRSLNVKLKQWMYTPDTANMLKSLAGLPHVADWRQEWQGNQAYMQNMGYINLSRNNYVARIPGVDYLFKIAGPENRLFSMLATKGIVDQRLWQDASFFDQQVKRLLPHALPTYQTASRGAYYLLLRLLMCVKDFLYVRVPQTYLMVIPGAHRTVADGNLMIIQQYVGDSDKLITKPELVQMLPNRGAQELYEVVVATGIWNLKDNVLIKRGIIHMTNGLNIVGLEQPANTSAKDFFHKSKERFDANVYEGLKQLLDLLAPDGQKVMFVKELMRRDPRLRRSNYYQGILDLST